MTKMILVQDKDGNTVHSFWLTKASEMPLTLHGINARKDDTCDPWKILALAVFAHAVDEERAGDIGSYYWLMSSLGGEFFCDALGMDYAYMRKWANNYYYEYIESGYLEYMRSEASLASLIGEE